MFSAVVLDEDSRARLFRAFDNGLLDGAERVLCHHVTLAMGATLREGYTLGERVEFVANAFGEVSGRVMAVRVLGVSRLDGKTPHVTLATFGEGKPKESNDITLWRSLPEPLELSGTVQFCQ